MAENGLLGIAARAVELAKSAGAAEAAAVSTRSRDVDVSWRDGKVETITEATERSLDVELYVDGRYAAVGTNDLRPEALATFIADAVVMTRALAVNKDRRLPDPELYAGRADVDLDLEDKTQAEVTPDDRKRYAAAVEEAARAVPGAGVILSVSTSSSDGWYEGAKVTSNGFTAWRRSTSFRGSAGVHVKDPDGRRPEESASTVSRHRADLSSPETVGREATERALARVGSVKGKSAVVPAIFENRVAGRLAGMLLSPMSGSSLQQKRSFLEGKLDTPIGGKLLSIGDDPFVRRGLGSRLYDGEGLALKRRVIVEEGVLKSYFLDTYYARKLGVAPTSGGATNIAWTLGDKDMEALVATVKDGVLITGFLGGNSNPATGDFSYGVSGWHIRDGVRAEAIGEMNASGNQLDLWQRLVAVGNDPYRWSSARTPTLMFDAVQLAGV